MNQTMDCGEARISLGVYVLGAIDPAERAMVDAHLATCRDCRDELAGLAGLPALLARVSPEEALYLGEEDFPGELSTTAPESPPELLGSVLDLAAARRRRRGWRNALLASAAAAVIAAGAFTGTHFLTNTPSGSPVAASVASEHGDSSNFGVGGPWDTAQVTSAAGQGVTVHYRQMGWGLQIDTKVVGIPVGTTCELYVITKDGKHIAAGGWVTDSGENTVWYSGSASVMDTQLAAFEVAIGGKTSPVIVPTGTGN